MILLERGQDRQRGEHRPPDRPRPGDQPRGVVPEGDFAGAHTDSLTAGTYRNRINILGVIPGGSVSNFRENPRKTK